jgi:hypothetical protein
METIDTEQKINCIVCNKEMDNWVYEHQGIKTEVHPMSGLRFRTTGHYGSAIFDPMGTGEALDIAVCDLCIMKNLDKVRGTGKEELVFEADILLDALERHG